MTKIGKSRAANLPIPALRCLRECLLRKCRPILQSDRNGRNRAIRQLEADRRKTTHCGRSQAIRRVAEVDPNRPFLVGPLADIHGFVDPADARRLSRDVEHERQRMTFSQVPQEAARESERK
jgi:hypothetical protein